MSTYERLIAMRECLRQVQKLLPKSANGGLQFICHAIDDTECSTVAIDDVRRYVNASIAPYYTFNGCMETLNPNRKFSDLQIMELRQKFIDSLCDHLNKEIEKVRP